MANQTLMIPKNNAGSTLASGITNVATSMSVAAGEGVRFPTTFPFPVVVFTADLTLPWGEQMIDMEIVLCTARVVDVLTMERSQEGTSNVAHGAGSYVRLHITAKFISDLNEASRKNAIINGNFDIWQRGTSFASPADNTYIADRFCIRSGLGDGTITASRMATTVAVGFPYSYAIKVDCTAAETTVAAGEFLSIQYKVEGIDFKRFEGETATLSFWVNAIKAGIYCVSFRNSAVDKSYVAEFTVNTTNTWEKKTVTLTFNSGGTFLYTTGIGLYVNWAIVAGSSFQVAANSWQAGNYLATSNQVNGLDNAANNFYLTGVQLELGSVATPFEFRPYQQELALCQRYYQRLVAGAAYAIFGFGENYGTNTQAIWIPFLQEMRIAPTLAGVSNCAYYSATAGLQATTGAVSMDNISKFSMRVTDAATGTAGQAVRFIANNNVAAYVEMGCEL